MWQAPTPTFLGTRVFEAWDLGDLARYIAPSPGAGGDGGVLPAPPVEEPIPDEKFRFSA